MPSTSVTYQLVPGMTVDVTVRDEWTTPGPTDRVRDPEWRAVDSASHGHFAASENGRVTYPTLKWSAHLLADNDGEEYDAGWWVCPTCGAKISPDTRAALPEKVASRRSYRLTIDEPTVLRVYEFNEADWKAVEASVADAVETAVDGMSAVRMEIRSA